RTGRRGRDETLPGSASGLPPSMTRPTTAASGVRVSPSSRPEARIIHCQIGVSARIFLIVALLQRPATAPRPRTRAMPIPADALAKRAANHQPLTPIAFLARAALVHPGHVAVIHGAARVTYADFYARARRLASALAAAGLGVGDTVSAMLANTPPMLEA